MIWTVTVSKRAQKLIRRLPLRIKDSLIALFRDIENQGPVRGNWLHYSSLDHHRHHCHLKKGRPTYVAVWKVVSQDMKIVEIIYVGTHENAPY